jgi:hypothetical protein
VDIEWVHPTAAASVKAAKQMVTAFGMDDLLTAPALHSLHNERNAIDMTIAWTSIVNVKDAAGNVVVVNTSPRTGMNKQLKLIGASYGVKKFVGGVKDKPPLVNDRALIQELYYENSFDNIMRHYNFVCSG